VPDAISVNGTVSRLVLEDLRERAGVSKHRGNVNMEAVNNVKYMYRK